MRLINVQYIPLNKLKPDFAPKTTQRLRSLMADCMHVIAVKKNKKTVNTSSLADMTVMSICENIQLTNMPFVFWTKARSLKEQND